MPHQANGQYQAQGTDESGQAVLQPGHAFFYVVPWDTAHWMDPCMVDVRENEESGKFLKRFIKRANKFGSMFGRGKGNAEYVGFAKENTLKPHVTKVYATTRFASSSFSQFESIYVSHEALCKAFSKMREKDNEEKEMKYMVKGRDFCLHLNGIIDVPSKPMEIMTKSQSLDQYLWSVTKRWPRVEIILSIMRREIFIEDNAKDCIFKGVALLPGWIVKLDDE